MSAKPVSAKPAASDRPPSPTLSVLTTAGFADYELLDSGHGRKLERFGPFQIERPEPQAMWRPVLAPTAWLGADAVFKAKAGEEDGEGGRWRTKRTLPEAWPIAVLGVVALCRLTAFRHLGLFPEQLPHWAWMLERLRGVEGERPRVLNLFAYTGVASLIAAKAGADVTHVDASRKAITWAHHNQAASRLGDASIRYIVEDARKFAAREVRRGKTYHLILVDPPKFGRGPQNEVWEVFLDLAPLMRDCVALLAPQQAALILTSYAIRASALSLDALLRDCVAGRAGAVASGELAIVEKAGGRLLGCSMFTRWVSDASPL
jgi:23S rRNA (cytosine1962-C5)-methyltransferase